MWKKTTVILWTLCILAANTCTWGKTASEPNWPRPADVISIDIVTISVEQQYEVVRPGTESALAIHFEPKEDWHFYASPETAPGGMNLKIKPSAPQTITFSEPMFPPSEAYFDKTLNIKLEVYSNKFTVFLPFSVSPFQPSPSKIGIKISIEGAICSEMQCRVPDFGQLSTEIQIASDAAMSEPKFALPDSEKAVMEERPAGQNEWASYSAWFAFGLAFLAGVVLNIMPCVLPVIPLKVLSIFEQAKQSRARCIAMGLSFCLGILLFFASLAALNIILRLGYGTVFQWGDHFRNPVFVVGMSLLMVLLALFMFGVFTVTVPSSIAGKAGPGQGHLGSVGMGFLAGLLSTPCSFAILTAAFAWAQTQKLTLATIAIMLIGVGMAAPYAILTSMPSLLKYLPKAGRWTELFKQTMGFVLLIVAVWLITALPELRKDGVLYFVVILAFCVWMWGGWVGFSTPAVRKWVIRIVAVVIAAAAGVWLLPGPGAERIDWQQYDTALIEQAIEEQKPVLIEFMADWCLSCKTVEKVVYSRVDIAKLIEQKGVLAIKADTTEKNFPATLALKNVYNEPGVPVSMLFAPGEREPIRWRGILFADELKKALNELSDRIENGSKSKDEGKG
ncbi:MAG: cytochrome c biogenesis protein CcdA [Sedimentisphaerales bacterium]